MKLEVGKEYGIVFDQGTMDVRITEAFDGDNDGWINGVIIGGDTGDFRNVQLAARCAQVVIELEHGYLDRAQVRCKEHIAAQVRNQNDMQDAIDQANGKSGPQLHIPRNEN